MLSSEQNWKRQAMSAYVFFGWQTSPTNLHARKIARKQHFSGHANAFIDFYVSNEIVFD
jgi:hypothetical protein